MNGVINICLLGFTKSHLFFKLDIMLNLKICLVFVDPICCIYICNIKYPSKDENAIQEINRCRLKKTCFTFISLYLWSPVLDDCFYRGITPLIMIG